MTATISAWLRRGATAVAAGRVAIGLVALGSPALIARPWIGPPADSAQARVLARALGGRDLALGLGALAALRGPSAGARSAGARSAGARSAAARSAAARSAGARSAAARSAGAWVGAAAIADALDALVTAASWHELPASRWLVALSAGGAAAIGAAAAAALLAGEAADGS